MTNITPPTVSFVDNPHAPDFFADGFSGFFNLNGIVRTIFESIRVNHVTTPGPINRVVIGRLVMPIDAAENLAKGLLDFITQQRTQTNPPVQQSSETKH
jgi:hypothetical protein